MSQIDAKDVPADETSRERLAVQTLDYRVTSADEADDWTRADARGFNSPVPTADELRFARGVFAERRNIGVYEGAGEMPIATVCSWVTPMTVPGGELDMWAISSVTVASTHRRRGIARALLEGELRAAAAADVPVAGLTVTEATIYGRYGFASAIPVARMKIDAQRAGWAGPSAPGRIAYVSREDAVDLLGELHERTRTARAGQIAGWRSRWVQHSGLAAGQEKGASVRAVQYTDEQGQLQGALTYSLRERTSGFRFDLAIHQLIAASDEALVALWGFALNHDLVDQITADLRPVDDPLPWLVTNRRGVEMTPHDHGWLRILNVPEALTGRRYSAPLDLVLQVDDPLDFAAGLWCFAVDDEGTASVTEVSNTAPDVRCDVNALSAIYAGGYPAAPLAAAGRMQASPETVTALTRAFATDAAPTLSIWY
ncbi:MAG: GNAT family N-acetyltransferase [Microbacterium sp.]